MSIVVVGGGAIGLLVAGRLALACQPVALLGRPGTVQALTEPGLTLRHEGRVEHVPALRAAAAPSELPPECRQPALAILCVKGYDTEGALPALAELGATQILTLQNGIGNEEALAARFGAGLIIAGVITISVEPESPASIVVTKAGGIGLAALEPGRGLEPWVAVLRTAGFTVNEYADYRAMKWSKALLNMLGNATAAILDMPVAAVYADSRLVALERRAFREALAVMARMGIRPVNLPRYPAAMLAAAMRWLPPPLLYPLLRRRVAGGRGGKAPSLLRDLRAGRSRSEGAFLNGAIAEQARALGVPAPANAAIWGALSAIASGERPWDEYRGKPERLLREMRD